jgi:phage I-like protein
MAIASLTFSLSGGSAEIQITPPGPAFRADDGSGRPADVPAWRIDRSIAGRIAARLSARKNPLVIDYEHQTLLAEKNGQPAPAAGWFKDVEWREGQGLFATDVEWTAKAAAMIAAGEYKFISPVFYYEPRTGEISAIHTVALTNNPGLDGMSAVALSAAFSRLEPEVTPMDELLQQLRAALGLADDQDAQAALAAIDALKTKIGDLEQKVEESAASQAALTAQRATAPDPAKFAPIAVVTELQNQVAALTAAHDKATVDTLFASARDAGKVISPEYEAHLRTIPVVALKGVLDGLASYAALTGLQSDGVSVGRDGKPAPGSAELAVMKALVLTAEEFAKGKE